MADTVRKLIDRVDIIKDIEENITPIYFPKETLDKNRTSVYGWLTETLAKSIEDTITLEQRRANDYCPELSNSEIHVNQTAKIRGVGVNRATPGKCFALLAILKSDILSKGISYNAGGEIRLTIDRRSTILYGGVNFSLEDDILIRAVRRGTTYLYTANYTGEHSNYDSYIQMYEQTNQQGEELVAMICQIYQYKYNITEKHVTDLIEFTYDGLYFDYKNRLASFEVFYKQSSSSEYKKASLDHYLTMVTSNSLYYNDDESGLIRIINNPALNIGINAVIKVEIKETLGTDGDITVNRNDTASFSMYRDAAYNYSGVQVYVTMLSDTSGAVNGDTLPDLKARLIDAKVRRDNITTEHDIIQFVNDEDANIQLIKKRNDSMDHRYYIYTLMRYDDEEESNKIAPATTKRLNLTGIRSATDWGDFDRYDQTVDRKLLKAYNKFKLHISEDPEDYPDGDYVTKCPIDEDEPDAQYLTCPFMIIVNDLNLASFYYTSVDENINLSMKVANSLFPYQMITRSVHIYRNAHHPTENDIYTFTVKGMLNTENDSILVTDEGELIDDEGVMCYIFFTKDGSPAAFLPMNIASYDSTTREFTFVGSIQTTDYITPDSKLEIIRGLYQLGDTRNYDSVIDYRDASFQVSFMFKFDDTENLYPKSDGVYSMLPSSQTDGYILMNSYYNNPNNLYNLVLEYGKFSQSPTKTIRAGQNIVDYSIGSVPFFEFNFGCEYTSKLFDSFQNMTDVYGELMKLTTGFDISLKFTATYGASKYITVTGGRTLEGTETSADLKELTPTIYFKVYGIGAPIDEIYTFIYKYLRDTYIQKSRIFMSNICTAVEQNFPEVKSIKYMGVEGLDASYQQFVYNEPVFDSDDIVDKYVPEQLNIFDIHIDLDET